MAYGGGAASQGAGQFSALDDSDEEDEGGGYVLHVRTALLEAKKGAITALGEMAAHTGAAFCPHLEESMTVLQSAAGNWHPLIKGETAESGRDVSASVPQIVRGLRIGASLSSLESEGAR